MNENRGPSGSARRVELPEEFNLADYYLFDRLDEGLADKVAIRYGDRSYTYGGVADRTFALARYFRSHGIGREQRVYTVLPDVPAFAWSFFATLAHGAVVAMGNPVAPKDDLAYVIEYSRAEVLVTLPAVADQLAPVLRESPCLRAVLLVPETATGEDCEGPITIPAALDDASFEVLALTDAIEAGARAKVSTWPATKRDDLAIWLFTSGSTGRPKAAVHTHRDFAFNTEVYAKSTVGYERDDISISVPRLFFGYATGTNLMFPFAVGATTCLFSERCTPERLAKAIESYRPTIVTNVPTMMSKLLDYDESQDAKGKPLDLSCIRFHLSAGEALPPILLQRFMARFGNDVYDGIGSAEMFHIYASNRPGDIQPGSLGRVVDGYAIRILPRDAEEPGVTPLAPGETGVMWVKGDSVAQCYFQDREKSWQTFHGHWCRTGDLFRLDEEGYLWFSGRADSLFKSGGIWVAPLEIEDCLMQHPGVAMAAVIPAKHEGLEKPKAFVVVRDSESAKIANDYLKASFCSDLQDHVKDRLSKHKYPRWVVFVDDLPKNDRGKVDRKLLVERESQGLNPWT